MYWFDLHFKNVLEHMIISMENMNTITDCRILTEADFDHETFRVLCLSGIDINTYISIQM